MTRKNSFYPFSEEFQWCGEIHSLRRNIPVITHLCDVSGVEYAQTREGVLVCAGHKGSRFSLFAEFAKTVPQVFAQERPLIHSPEFYQL